MTMEQKKNELSDYLISVKGIFNPEDVEAEIVKMAAACPAPTAAEKGLVDNIDKAYEVMCIEKGIETKVSPVATTGAVAPSQPTSQFTAAETSEITNKILNDQATRTMVSSTTLIEGYILQRPGLDKLIDAGEMGVINKESFDKMVKKLSPEGLNNEKWVLVDDPEKGINSTANYAALKEAAEKGTPVEIHKSAGSKKVAGYRARKGSATGTSNVVSIMTRNDMQNFIALEGLGYVQACDGDQKRPGVKLRTPKPKTNATNGGRAVQKKNSVQMVDTLKKEAMENQNFITFAEEVLPETNSKNVSSELCFKVQVTKDGVTRTVTKRAPLKANVHATEVVADELKDFKIISASANSNLTEAPNAKQKDALLASTVGIISALLADTQNMTSLQMNDKETYEKLVAFKPTTSQPTSNVTI